MNLPTESNESDVRIEHGATVNAGHLSENIDMRQHLIPLPEPFIR
jgi:hypothetical protein